MTVPGLQAEYQPPWPTRFPSHLDVDESLCSWFIKQLYLLIKDIAWHLGLPVGFSRLAERAFKDLTSILIYPASIMSVLYQKDVKARHQYLIQTQGAIEVPLRTPDDYKIDNLLFRGIQKKAIIYLGGRISYFQDQSCTEYIRTIQKDVGDVSLFLINPRGVGLSDGKPSTDGIELDVYTAFKYLVDREGIHPNDIIIYGYSLGGATGMLGAELIQEEYPHAEINIVSDRSFSNIEEEAVEIIRYYCPPIPWLADLLCTLGLKLLHASNTQMDIEKAVSKLKGKKCIIYHRHDEGTPYRASLYFKYKQKYRPGQQPPESPIRCIKLLTDEAEGESPHTRSFHPWEQFEVINEIRRMFGMPATAPLLMTRVKDLGSQQLLPRFIRSNPSYLSILSLEKMHQLLLCNPGRDYLALQRTIDIIHSAAKDRAAFSEQLLSHEKRLQALLLFSPHISANRLKEFYLRVLQRTQVDLICREIEKTVLCPTIHREELSWLLQKLERVQLHAEDCPQGHLPNYAHFLFKEIYDLSEQPSLPVHSSLRSIDSEFGRHAAHGILPLAATILRSAVNNLKNELMRKKISV